MRAAVQSQVLVAIALVGCAIARPQSPAVLNVGASPSMNPTSVLLVPTGERLVLELKSPLNTRTARKGEQAYLSSTNEVVVGDQVAIPRGAVVHATVTQAKRGGLIGKPQLQLQFNEIILADGSLHPLSANLTRADWLRPKGRHFKARIRQTIAVMPSDAAGGALLGLIFGGWGNVGRGAAIGASIGVIHVASQRGPDLTWPRGMLFEIELTKPLEVPVRNHVGPNGELAVRQNSSSEGIGTESPNKETRQPAGAPAMSTNTIPRLAAKNNSEESQNIPGNRTSTPAIEPPADTVRGTSVRGGFVLKVDVNLVLVEATVRDAHGRIVDKLKREDFRLAEDGVEQQITHFSRDELPLAVALVVDRSGSMIPVFNDLRHAAYDTLSLLKPDDQVALFAFATSSELLEDLTTDRRLIADDIAGIRAGGGTNITDALFDAALYLSRAAPSRRHAIILISDNAGTFPGFASESDVIRQALESEASIYSIKIGGSLPSGIVLRPIRIPGTGSVPKIARETGGEVIDANDPTMVRSALNIVITRFKQRYTLGYSSTNPRRDGAFRRIEVSVRGHAQSPHDKYLVYARQGYYARTEKPASAKHRP